MMMAAPMNLPPDHEILCIDYLHGGCVQYRPGESLALRTLHDYELVLIIEGHVRYEVDGQTFNVPPGGAILARPGFEEHYEWDPDRMTRHAYLHFQLSSIPAGWPDPEQWPIVTEHPPAVLASMFRYLLERTSSHSEWPASAPGTDTTRFLECILHTLITPSQGNIQSQTSIPQPVNHALNLMREILDASPVGELNLMILANRAAVTQKHLCRLFQQSLGHAPMKTFRLLKLQLAMALLARSNLAISEIAYRCGFENPFYFSRCFSQTYGASPTKVRMALRKGEPPPLNPLPPELMPRLYW